jgi:transcriptional regulator with XRE-family HTH domain
VSLAELLRAVRVRADVSPTDAAKLVGVTPSAVWNWEAGVVPRASTLGAYLTGLDATETEKALALDLAGAQHSQASDEDAA